MRTSRLGALVLVAILVAGCGSEDNGGALDAGDGGSTLAGPVSSAVVVTVTADGEPVRNGSVSCIESGASGTGHLINAQASADACALFEDAAAASRLIDGPPGDRACTEQYGGPERAEVTGKVNGQDVEAEIDRSDGCGISDWELLQPLLGPPIS